MIPKKAFTTGELLEWQKVNIKALLVMFEKHYGKESGDYDFWGWMYERLERNQKHVKQSLKLGHLIKCDKDGKPLNITEESFYLESPENQKAFEQAENDVIFDGWTYYPPNGMLSNPTLVKDDNIQHIIEITKTGWKLDVVKLETIEQFIQIPDIKITDNYYSKTFKL